MLSHWLMLQRPPLKGATQNAPQLTPPAVPICTISSCLLSHCLCFPSFCWTTKRTNQSLNCAQHCLVNSWNPKGKRHVWGEKKYRVNHETLTVSSLSARTKLLLRTLKFITGLNPSKTSTECCPTRQDATVLCQFSHVALFLVISPQFLSNYSLNLLSKNHLQDIPSLYQQFTLSALPEILCSFFTSQPCLNAWNHTNQTIMQTSLNNYCLIKNLSMSGINKTVRVNLHHQTQVWEHNKMTWEQLLTCFRKHLSCHQH